MSNVELKERMEKMLENDAAPSRSSAAATVTKGGNFQAVSPPDSKKIFGMNVTTFMVLCILVIIVCIKFDTVLNIINPTPNWNQDEIANAYEYSNADYTEDDTIEQDNKIHTATVSAKTLIQSNDDVENGVSPIKKKNKDPFFQEFI